MTVLPKTFKHDHVVRDAKGMPLGRVILANDDDYEGGKPILVAMLSVPVSKATKLQALTFFVDGAPYRLPSEIPLLKIRRSGGLHRVNNFILQPVL